MASRGAIVLVIVLASVVGTFGARQAQWYQTGDFYCLYQGARFLTLGQDPYDESKWRDVVSRPLPSMFGGEALPPCPGRYGYPLWTAVLLLPLGMLPIEAAAATWLTLSISAAVAGLALTWRALALTRRYAMLYAVAVVMSQPFWILLISGQTSGLLLGLGGATLWALARGKAAGGIALMLAALKPQTVGVTIPAVLLRAAIERRASFVIASLVTGAAMVLVPLLFVRAWPIEWLGELGTRRLRVAGDMPTAWGFANHVLGDMLWGVPILVALLAVVAFLARDRLDVPSILVLSLPFSLLATPYAWSYDHLVLAIAWGLLFAQAAVAADRLRAAVLLAAALLLACVLPWVLYAISFARGEESVTAVVPALTAVAAALAIRIAPTHRISKPRTTVGAA